jgi:hypothetical protein
LLYLGMMMSKPVILSNATWLKIYDNIARAYPPSVLLIKDKMRSVLGFTSRSHSEWVPKMSGGYYEHTIRLDFYNEPKRTMFLLKYSEYLDKSDNTTLDIE